MTKAKKQKKVIELESQDLSKKIGDIKRIFNARTGMIKDRNGKDLIEEEQSKNRWQECTEKNYTKKGLR